LRKGEPRRIPMGKKNEHPDRVITKRRGSSRKGRRKNLAKFGWRGSKREGRGRRSKGGMKTILDISVNGIKRKLGHQNMKTEKSPKESMLSPWPGQRGELPNRSGPGGDELGETIRAGAHRTERLGGTWVGKLIKKGKGP